MAKKIVDIQLRADESKYVRSLTKAGSRTQKFMGTVKALGSAFAAYIGVRGLGATIEAYKKQEQATAKLNNALQATGRAIPSKEIQKLAGQIQKNGIFGDEALIEASAMLATFTSISDDAMPRAMQVAADLAAQFGISLDSAAKLVGKASMGMTGDLSRVGITLSDAAKESKDFNLILKDMEGQSQGANKALGETATGGLTQLTMAWGDFMEIVGKGVVETLKPATEAFTSLLSRLNEVLTQSDFEKHQEHLTGLRKELAHVLTLTQADYENDRFQTWASDVKRLREEIALLEGATQANEFGGGDANAAAQAAFDKAEALKAAKEAERVEAEADKQAEEDVVPSISKGSAEAFAAAMAEKARIENEIKDAQAAADLERQIQLSEDLAAAGLAVDAATKHEEMMTRLDASWKDEQKKWKLHNDIKAAAVEQAQKREQKAKADAAKQEVAMRAAADDLITALASQKSKKLQTISKAMQMVKKVEIIGNQAVSLSNAVSSASAVPFPGNLAAIATSVATILAQFASMPKFAKGGIVPGGAPFTDRVPIMAMPGEAVLNREDTRELLSQGAKAGTQKVEIELVGEASDLFRAQTDRDDALGTGRNF